MKCVLIAQTHRKEGDKPIIRVKDDIAKLLVDSGKGEYVAKSVWRAQQLAVKNGEVA